MPKVYLSDELCAKARDKLEELLECTDEKGILIQHRAAESLVSKCQAQERYNLRPQNEDDFKKHAKIQGSEAKQLNDMTPEELLEEQQRMMGNNYPGFPA